MRQLRLHMLAAQGYCVVTIDSRGSQSRGVKFEGHIKGRLVICLSFSILNPHRQSAYC